MKQGAMSLMTFISGSKQDGTEYVHNTEGVWEAEWKLMHNSLVGMGSSKKRVSESGSGRVGQEGQRQVDQVE